MVAITGLLNLKHASFHNRCSSLFRLFQWRSKLGRPSNIIQYIGSCFASDCLTRHLRLIRAILIKYVLPLEYALIIAARRDQVGCVLDEAAVGDVRGVPAEFHEKTPVDWARVPEQFHFTEIVCGREDCAVGAPVASVDIRAVRCRREYTLNWPSQGAGPRLPSLIFEGTGTARVVFACICVKE